MNILVLAPFLLSLGNIGATFIQGNKQSWTWILKGSIHMLYSFYFICTHQWGFILANLFCVGLCGKNYFKWRKEEDDRKKKIGSFTDVQTDASCAPTLQKAN